MNCYTMSHNCCFGDPDKVVACKLDIERAEVVICAVLPYALTPVRLQ